MTCYIAHMHYGLKYVNFVLDYSITKSRNLIGQSQELLIYLGVFEPSRQRAGQKKFM